MSKELNNPIDEAVEIDLKKRDFMDKMGKYAIVGAGMATLMTPSASSANNYGAHCGSGKRHHGRKKHGGGFFRSFFDR